MRKFCTGTEYSLQLSPACAHVHVLESVLVSLYSSFVYGDHLQFGFKANSGCNDALFTLMESAQYFNKRNSTAFLDASKAFDKVLINCLIYKPIRRNVPLHFIRLFNNLSSSRSLHFLYTCIIVDPMRPIVSS